MKIVYNVVEIFGVQVEHGVHVFVLCVHIHINKLFKDKLVYYKNLEDLKKFYNLVCIL